MTNGTNLHSSLILTVKHWKKRRYCLTIFSVDLPKWNPATDSTAQKHDESLGYMCPCLGEKMLCTGNQECTVCVCVYIYIYNCFVNLKCHILHSQVV
jgi:hypothetical protein